MHRPEPTQHAPATPSDDDVRYHWRELDIPEFDVIQQRLVPWVLHRYPDSSMGFWNHADQAALFEAVPELETTIQRVMGQTPVMTYLLIVGPENSWQHSGRSNENSLHRDTSTESCRLNWPILNSTSIETRIYRSDSEPERLLLPSGTSYLRYHEPQCEFLGSFRMSRPTLLRVHSIHGLFRVEGALPRYILSFKFAQDISHLLDPHEHVF
jgi:hypothetical protein